MRVLVLGGTRYFGRLIVQRLVAAGYAVTVLTRGTTRPRLPDGVEHVARDRTDHAGLVAWLRGTRFDAIIDNIAMDGPDVRAIVDGAGGRTGHYLLTSTGSVYHQPFPRHPVREADADLAYRGDGAYGEGKRRAEAVLRDEVGDVFPWTILRPRVVLGPGDHTLREWWYTRRVLDGQPIVLPAEYVDAETTHTYADDLAGLYLAALGNSRAFNKVYNAAQPELLSSRAFVAALGAALGQEPEIVAVPAAVIAAAGLPGYAPPLTRPFGPSDIAAARCDLGFSPTPLVDWLGATARWSAEHNLARPAGGYEARAVETAIATRYRDRLRELNAAFAR